MHLRQFERCNNGCLLFSKCIKARREATWILANAVIQSNLEQLIYLFQNRVLDCFCDMLDSEDPGILEVVIDGLGHFLRKGEQFAKIRNCENPFYAELEKREGLEKIENLQKHKEEKVYEAALRFLEKNYDVEDDI